MGRTISDFNREYYNDMINQGYSYTQIIKSVPKKMREKFINDLNKTPIESHFGVKNRVFYISILTVIVISLIFGLSSCNNEKKDNRLDIISDNIQSIGYIKIDLDFKPISIKQIYQIKVKDSLQYCDSIIKVPIGKEINNQSLNKFINTCDSCILKYTKAKETNDIILWLYLKHKTISYIKYMDMDSNKVLSNVVYCKFSIKNPYKKDDRIELNRLFFFTPDNNKIIISQNL